MIQFIIIVTRIHWAAVIVLGLVTKLLALVAYLLAVFGGSDPSMQPRAMYTADLIGNSMVALLFVLEGCWEYSAVQQLAKQEILLRTAVNVQERETSLA